MKQEQELYHLEKQLAAQRLDGTAPIVTTFSENLNDALEVKAIDGVAGAKGVHTYVFPCSDEVVDSGSVAGGGADRVPEVVPEGV
eukprot:5814575-Pyramimonas_sp.AAC.1